jgi:phage tail-like protein
VNGWLLAQLPRAMTGNLLVQAFVDAAEHTGDSVRVQLDGLEYQLDPDLASPQMLIYLGSWLGFPLDALDDPAFHRPLLRAVGRLLMQRGTKAAVRELLTQLTGGPVSVEDGGGVFGPGQQVPEENPTVRVELSRIGPISPERLAAIIERELPIGARLELIVPHDGEHQERQA